MAYVSNHIEICLQENYDNKMLNSSSTELRLSIVFIS